MFQTAAGVTVPYPEKLSEQYLRDVQIHNTVEQQHLATFLPALYAEYKDLPQDAD